LVNLGSVYSKAGDYEKAKDLFEQSLVIYKKYLPENHIGKAQALRHLGNIYRRLGDYKKAKNLLEESFLVYKQYFPENHSELTWGLKSLGNFYKSIKNYKEAKCFFEKSLIANEMNYGKDHIETARAVRNLGEICLMEGDLETAEHLLNKALTIFQKNKYLEIYVPLESLSDLYLEKSIHAIQVGNIQKSKEFKTQSIKYLIKARKSVEANLPEASTQLPKIYMKLKKIKNSH
jgi:tetratricopeptide (TPR) repeat protein